MKTKPADTSYGTVYSKGFVKSCEYVEMVYISALWGICWIMIDLFLLDLVGILRVF